MTDLIILIVVSVILVETSVLLLQKKPSFRGERMILVDTSVLIDGRILDIAESGFVPGRLVIPRSVLGELQLLADGSDHEKRNRARAGLEVITKLQAIPTLNLEIYRDQSDAREGVDNRLLALARRLNYELCTVDYNLQKVAQAEGITTLSINELSQKLRVLYLPGEKLQLTLKQKGQEKGQAVGYASDGTMVVVDNADKLIDQTVTVEVIRSLQTNSGKMMFGRLQKDTQGHGAKQTVRPARTSLISRLSDQRRSKMTQAEAPANLQQEGTATREQRQTQPRQQKPVVARSAQPTEQLNKPAESRQQPRQSRGRRASQSPEDELLNLVNNQDQ